MMVEVAYLKLLYSPTSDRDLVKQIYAKVVLLLKRNQILGILAIIGCFIGLTPFLGFLALKTGWDIKKNWNKKAEKLITYLLLLFLYHYLQC